MADYLVRRAAPGDEDRLAPLMLDYIVGFYGQSQPDGTELLRLIRRLFDGRDGVQYVAESGGELVGFATVYLTWSSLSVTRAAILNDLFVEEGWRGTDVARDLLSACADCARAEGCRTMSWETASSNARAQAFYDKIGARRESWVVYELDL